MSSEGTCRSQACLAPLIWAETVKGKMIPLDRDAVDRPANDDRTWRSIFVFGTDGRVRHVTPQEPVSGPLFVCHFATCKDIDKFKKRRTG